MFRRLALISFLCVLGPSIPARATEQCCLEPAEWATFHDKDVQKWSAKSGLFSKTIQAILTSIGEDNPDENQYLIQRMDTRSFSAERQVLVALTDFGTAHWLSVWVVQANPPYRSLWHTSSIQENGTCPEVDLGTDSTLGEATASATTNGQILIKIPRKRSGNGDQDDQKTQLLVATYIWVGKTYRLQREQLFSRYEWTGNDYVTHGPGTPPICP